MPGKAYLHIDLNPAAPTIDFAACAITAEFNKPRREIRKLKFYTE